MAQRPRPTKRVSSNPNAHQIEQFCSTWNLSEHSQNCLMALPVLTLDTVLRDFWIPESGGSADTVLARCINEAGSAATSADAPKWQAPDAAPMWQALDADAAPVSGASHLGAGAPPALDADDTVPSDTPAWTAPAVANSVWKGDKNASPSWKTGKSLSSSSVWTGDKPAWKGDKAASNASPSWKSDMGASNTNAWKGDKLASNASPSWRSDKGSSNTNAFKGNNPTYGSPSWKGNKSSFATSNAWKGDQSGGTQGWKGPSAPSAASNSAPGWRSPADVAQSWRSSAPDPTTWRPPSSYGHHWPVSPQDGQPVQVTIHDDSALREPNLDKGQESHQWHDRREDGKVLSETMSLGRERNKRPAQSETATNKSTPHPTQTGAPLDDCSDVSSVDERPVPARSESSTKGKETVEVRIAAAVARRNQREDKQTARARNKGAKAAKGTGFGPNAGYAGNAPPYMHPQMYGMMNAQGQIISPQGQVIPPHMYGQMFPGQMTAPNTGYVMWNPQNMTSTQFIPVPVETTPRGPGTLTLPFHVPPTPPDDKQAVQQIRISSPSSSDDESATFREEEAEIFLAFRSAYPPMPPGYGFENFPQPEATM